MGFLRILVGLHVDCRAARTIRCEWLGIFIARRVIVGPCVKTLGTEKLIRVIKGTIGMNCRCSPNLISQSQLSEGGGHFVDAYITVYDGLAEVDREEAREDGSRDGLRIVLVPISIATQCYRDICSQS